MANLSTSSQSVFTINKFLGVNESADGDTKLPLGEAASMRNWKISDDLSLQIRPGTKTVAGLLSGYDTSVSSDRTVLLTETNVSTKVWTLYPDVALDASGNLTVSGTGVSVTYSNLSSYIGYYYKDNNGNVYALSGCTLTHPSAGTQVTGGTITISSQAEVIPIIIIGTTVTAYDSVCIAASSVSLGSSYTSYGLGDSSIAGKYISSTDKKIYQISNSNSVTKQVAGYLVSYAGDDTYVWNFYVVTKTTTSGDIQVQGLWHGYVANVETFTGNGSTAVFTLANTGAVISRVTIDDVKTEDYTYNSSAHTITFTAAPFNSAAIVVTEGSTEYLVAACNGRLWKISTDGNFTKTIIGSVVTTNGRVHMFGFNEKLYILDGSEYRVWDGTALETVSGYRPLVVTSSVPGGGGLALEQVNKLNGLRRVCFSPDGAASQFCLPEKELTGIDYVKNTVTGKKYKLSADYSADPATGRVTFVTAERTETLTGDGSTKVFKLSNDNVYLSGVKVGGNVSTTYTYNFAAGKIIFDTAPASGAVITVTETVVPVSDTNTIEIGYTYPKNYRGEVTKMRFSETYNGETDTRVFLYGDGTNTALYSGLDSSGTPRADYFPDLNEMAVDSANTPITAMIKHFDRLLTFKPDGAFITAYDTITLSDGSTTAGFYTSPLNRHIGHEAPGQAVLVRNNPFTLFGRSVYEWLLSSYSAKDERNATVNSRNVTRTLSTLELSEAVCFDDAECWELH